MSLDVVWFERKGGIHLGAVRSEGPKKVTLVDERGETLRIPKIRLLGGLQARVEKGGAKSVREGLRRLRRELGDRSDAPDLGGLWAALEDGQSYLLADLVDRSPTGASDRDDETVALVNALSPEGRRLERQFRIVDGRLVRVDAETLARLQERDERVAREASAGDAFMAWFEAGSERGDPPTEAQVGLDLLRAWALEGDKSERSGTARRLAERLDCADPDALLVTLEREGLLPRDVNELPGRRGVRVAFPAAALAAAAALPEGAPTGEDLQAIPTVAIDDPGTTEVDDALSYWEADGATWLAIHIARPEELLPDDPLDAEAQRRATSVYFPGETIPMLPLELVTNRWSLTAGDARASLSLVARIGPGGLPEPVAFKRTVVRVDRQVDYAGAPDDPVAGLVIAGLLPVAEALRAARIEAGARIVNSPQLKLTLTPDGPVPRKVPTDLPAHLVVSELMVFYNAQVAARLGAAGAAGFFRVQTEPVTAPKVDPADALASLRVRRGMPPTHVQFEPAPHCTMGLDAYLQATSPLRRLGDLIAQRQLLAILDGAPLPYDVARAKALQRDLNKLERRARQLEDERLRYLIARWLESVKTLEGVVSRAGRRPMVFLPAIDRELPLRLPRNEEPVVGTRLTVRPARLDPRARDILLERA